MNCSDARTKASSVAWDARFDEPCDLRDFDFTYNPEIPKSTLWELASGRYLDEHAAVLFCGPTGVGKSFVVQALGIAAASRAVYQDERAANRSPPAAVRTAAGRPVCGAT